MVLRAFGARRARGAARASTCAWPGLFAGWVDADPDWERVAPVPFSTVCFRRAAREWAGDHLHLRVPPSPLTDGGRGGPDDARLNDLNERLLAAVNASGEVYLSHAMIGGGYTLRLAIGNIRTEELHVARAWAILRAEALRLRATPRVVA